MKIGEAWTAVRQWGPFALRTAAYGTVSCLLGPFTRDHRASLWAMREWCRVSVRALDIVVDCSGAENVPQEGPFVYCSNHQSLVDIIVLGAVLPGDYKWAAKRSLMKIPFLGWHLKLSGHVPVDRGGGENAANEVVARFAEVLKAGKPLLIFPEGTRTLDGGVNSFKIGAFRAALRGMAPVVPVAICGTHNLMSKGEVSTGTGAKRVFVRMGTPLPVPRTGDETSSSEELRDQTHAAVRELFDSIGTPVPRGEDSPV